MNALSSPNATGPATRQSLRESSLHQRSLYQRSTFLVLLLALGSFVLTACSVDISNTQKMDEKGKDTRTMTAVVEVEDDDAAKVDAKKVEKSLKKAAKAKSSRENKGSRKNKAQQSVEPVNVYGERGA